MSSDVSPGRIRAYHSGYTPGRRAGQVQRLHIIREDGKFPGRQGLCGQPAWTTTKAPVVIVDPMPAVPPEGLRWCPLCIGHLADRCGRIEEVAATLAADGTVEGSVP